MSCCYSRKQKQTKSKKKEKHEKKRKKKRAKVREVKEASKQEATEGGAAGLEREEGAEKAVETETAGKKKETKIKIELLFVNIINIFCFYYLSTFLHEFLLFLLPI